MDKNNPLRKASAIRKKVMGMQDGKYTPEQMQQMGDAIHQLVSEFCDAYHFVGFVAEAKNEPIHLSVYNDARSGLALQKFLSDTAIPIGDDDDEDYA